MQTYVYSYTRGDLGTEFVYGEVHGFDTIGAEEIAHNIPIGDLEDSDGEYQSDSTIAARSVSVSGTVVGDSPQEVWTRTQELLGAHPKGPVGKFRARLYDDDGTTVLLDIYLPARVAGRRVEERRDDADARDFLISFRSSGAWWLDWSLQAPVTVPEAGGTASLTPGGSEWAAPIITLSVSAAGTITITPALVSSNSAESLVIAASGAGEYIIDCENQTLTKDGADALSEVVSGGFFEIPATATSINVALTDSAALSDDGTIEWRRRWTTGL